MVAAHGFLLVKYAAVEADVARALVRSHGPNPLSACATQSHLVSYRSINDQTVVI